MPTSTNAARAERPAVVPRRDRRVEPLPFGDRRLTAPLVMAAIVAVAVVGVVGVGLFTGGGPSYSCEELLQPQAGANPANPIITPNLDNDHVPAGSRIEYAHCPPASGPHYNASGVGPLRPGFYDADDGVGPGNWVHNLEHGFVVALYRCTDGVCPPEDQLAEVRRFIVNGPSTPTAAACGYQAKVVAARFDDMATPFALLAWDRVVLLDMFDVDVAEDFARRWIETTGPEPNGC